MSDDLYDNDSDLVKDLRKQIRERDKALQEVQSKLGELATKDRSRSLTDTLKGLNVSPKVASFYPSDREATEDNIKSWLSENADVFGIKLDAPPADAPAAPAVPDGVQRLQAVSTPDADMSAEATVLHQINQAASADDLVAMILAAGGGGVS